MKRMMMVVGLLLSLHLTVQGSRILTYSQDFETSVSGNWYPLDGKSRCDYWQSSDYGPNNLYFGSTVLWYAGNPGGVATEIKALRNFQTSGQLAANECFTSATVSGDFSNPGAWNDGRIQSRIGILDDAGNGYMGLTAYGGSLMFIYKVTGGVLASSPLVDKMYSSTLVNKKTLALDVQKDGVITFSLNTPGLSELVSVTDGTYANFTQIFVGGQVVTVTESHVIDNVNFTGTVVPEPTMLSIFLLSLIGLKKRK